MTTYKAISLWQPHAHLIGIGAKPYETRSWTTRYRGPVAIHAGKNDVELKQLAMHLGAANDRWLKKGFADSFRQVMRAWEGFTVDQLPLGALVAVGELTAIYDAALLYPKLTGHARHFGDFSAGRYAWRIDNVTMLPEPIPMRGQQGLWTVEL